MLLVRIVKVVYLLFKRVEDLAVSRHVSGQDQSDSSLETADMTGLPVWVGAEVDGGGGGKDEDQSETEAKEEGKWYLSDLLEGLLVKVGEDVAVGL